MARYQQTPTGILDTEKHVWVPVGDLSNADAREYAQWLADDNVPDAEPTPTIEELQASALTPLGAIAERIRSKWYAASGRDGGDAWVAMLVDECVRIADDGSPTELRYPLLTAEKRGAEDIEDVATRLFDDGELSDLVAGLASVAAVWDPLRVQIAEAVDESEIAAALTAIGAAAWPLPA